MEQVFILNWHTQDCTIKAWLPVLNYLLASSFCMLDSATFELHSYKNAPQVNEKCEIRHELKCNFKNTPWKYQRTVNTQFPVNMQFPEKYI